MTDIPIPEGNLTAAESEELLLICGHALGPEPLSPAAQAVLTAIIEISPAPADEIAATALRTAADQASPEKQVADIDYVHQSYVDGMKDALAVLQEIADELEGQA